MIVTWIHPFFATLVLAATVFLPTTSSSSAKPKCVMLTRASIEEKFGKPVKCLKEVKDIECFGHERGPVSVQFNSSGLAEKIWISTSCNGLWSLGKILDEKIPKNTRGKYRRRLEGAATSREGDGVVVTPGCKSVFREEYECLTIEYSQINCMGCAPALITVTWK